MSFGLKDDEEEDALLKRKYMCFVSKENYITYFVERNDTTKQSTNENCVFQRHVSYSILKSALQPHNLLLKKACICINQSINYAYIYISEVC